ncbi:5-methylthioadenosine/S-adenosylhomocysteine deaminase 1 [Paramyrothecium foliicola]|nr:5-methylthioadenosine/S-adenosylhomocysteine deaminase 1 [Paramyrothecium foliicola]
MRSSSLPIAAAAVVGLGSTLVGAANSSTLFSGGTIIAFDSASESLRIIDEGAVLVTGDRIARVFDSVPDSGAGIPLGTERIDVTGQIISPGFIDTHRHGWQTAFKTIGSNTSLSEYVGRYGEFAAEPFFTAEDVYAGQLAGLYEMLNAGVTTSLDHAHHTWSDETSVAGANASVQSGARVFWAYAIHELPNGNFSIEQQLANFRDIAESNLFEDSPSELALSFDAWSSTSDRSVVQEIADTAIAHNVSALTTHLVYGPWGFSNLPSTLHEFGILNTSIPVVFSHGSFMPAADAQLLRSTNQYISITPESEMHYGHTHEESRYIQDQASLGVDTHFTFSTDILTQARIWLQSVRYNFYHNVLRSWNVPTDTPMTVAQAFYLATRAGGLALRRPDLGVIEEGAKADLVIWDAENSPALLGWRDPVAAVILHASVADILHVTVDGKFVKRDGRIVASDYQDVRKRFQASARRIQDVWLGTPNPALTGTFLSGFEYEKPRRADTLRGQGDGYEMPVFVDPPQ